jgi:hypothetical protein
MATPPGNPVSVKRNLERVLPILRQRKLVDSCSRIVPLKGAEVVVLEVLEPVPL